MKSKSYAIHDKISSRKGKSKKAGRGDPFVETTDRYADVPVQGIVGIDGFFKSACFSGSKNECNAD